MNKRYQILLILLICLSPKLFSQKCKGLDETGDRLINETKNGVVCFLRETERKSDNLFFTRYTFKAEGGKETYYLEFAFYTDLNKISITYTNEDNESQSRDVPLDLGGSLILFKDYRSNDTAINKDELYHILFAITEEPQKRFVILYHFELMDNEAVIFKLKDILPERINYHNALSKNFLSKKLYPSPPTITGSAASSNTFNVTELIPEIRKYKDSVLSMIEYDLKKINEGRPIEANESLSSIFSNRLDLIFITYYKNVFPYQDFDSKIEMVFNCNREGKIEDLKSIRSINSPQVKWFEDNFRSNVLNLVTAEKFKLMKDTKSYNAILYDYNERFSEKIKKVNSAQNVDPYVLKELNEINELVLAEFQNYINREFDSPTRFTYTINYRSIVKHETWIHKITKGDVEICGPENSTEIILQELINKFKLNIPPKRKVTKYPVKRCDVYINGGRIGQDLQPA